MGPGNYMNDLFECSAEIESYDIDGPEFDAKNAKAFKRVFTAMAILSNAFGLLLWCFTKNEVAILFLFFGACALLLLPTMLSYKCHVSKVMLIEEYYVLFIKIRKEIPWSNVRYKKITTGNNKSIKLYDENFKKLISFDSSTVGYQRILKLAKRMDIISLSK